MVVDRKSPMRWVWRVIILIGVLFWIGFSFIVDYVPSRFFWVFSEYGYIFVIFIVAGVILLSVFGKKLAPMVKTLFKGEGGSDGSTTATPPKESYTFEPVPEHTRERTEVHTKADKVEKPKEKPAAKPKAKPKSGKNPLQRQAGIIEKHRKVQDKIIEAQVKGADISRADSMLSKVFPAMDREQFAKAETLLRQADREADKASKSIDTSSSEGSDDYHDSEYL